MKPITGTCLEKAMKATGIIDINSATIRQIVALANYLEQDLGDPYIHLELGNPGIPAEDIGITAQCKALQDGLSNQYPNIAGIPPLKKAGSRFLKAFLDIDIPARCIIPTVGSMQASFTMMMLLKQRDSKKDTMLFINPGFPAQRHQAKMIGLKTEAFDIYEYRGDKLGPKLESILEKGNVTGIIYSNPNNPAWTNLTQDELRTIGHLATKHDAIVLEDLAYMGMDFRIDLSHPFQPPYIPTVARYTDNCILLVSASKIFSYAGERIAMVCMTPQVYDRWYKMCDNFYEMANFGDCYVFGVLYTASSGVSHSSQHAFAAMLDAAADGSLDFVGHTREYGRRASRAREIFLRHGFNLVYSDDNGEPISNGFFFTMGYNDMESGALQKELMRYGVCPIPLVSTGSAQNGVRVTVSMLNNDRIFEMLDERLAAFNNDHRHDK